MVAGNERTRAGNPKQEAEAKQQQQQAAQADRGAGDGVSQCPVGGSAKQQVKTGEDAGGEAEEEAGYMSYCVLS